MNVFSADIIGWHLSLYLKNKDILSLLTTCKSYFQLKTNLLFQNILWKKYYEIMLKIKEFCFVNKLKIPQITPIDLLTLETSNQKIYLPHFSSLYILEKLFLNFTTNPKVFEAYLKIILRKRIDFEKYLKFIWFETKHNFSSNIISSTLKIICSFGTPKQIQSCIIHPFNDSLFYYTSLWNYTKPNISNASNFILLLEKLNDSSQYLNYINIKISQILISNQKILKQIIVNWYWNFNLDYQFLSDLKVSNEIFIFFVRYSKNIFEPSSRLWDIILTQSHVRNLAEPFRIALDYSLENHTPINIPWLLLLNEARTGNFKFIQIVIEKFPTFFHKSEKRKIRKYAKRHKWTSLQDI